MKNKFYTSLLMGVGLAIACTYSYAKPTHSSAKRQVSASAKHSKKHIIVAIKPDKAHSRNTKHTSTPAKHSKKQGVVAIKLGKPHVHETLVTHLKNSRKKHVDNTTAKQVIFNRKPHKLAAYTLEKSLPPPDLTLASTRIPHLPSNNRLVQLEIQPTENNDRIHSFISADSEESNDVINHSRTEASHQYTTAHGIITSSLSAAGQEAGLSDELITQLTNIFAWDIDFATNLHRGDQFTLVYEQGGNAQIIAAEFVAQGRILTAVNYEDSNGNINYYTPEGKAMRKAFLSTPVDYVRISSHFDANRKHPILNRIRAHKGVDYAARTGTPVKAAGDGNIVFIGRKGGYGQVMIVKHGEHYETLYAHLSGFKKGLLDGDSVTQGDIIGYVGQTGLATGPHLHYEFRVDGEHRNPENQAPRHLMALNGHLLGDFKAQAHPVLAQLYSAKAQTLLAKNLHNTD
ncbi:MAG: peptidoglycan DD-metalloendopeptidase family protein [Methylovulum sp.]|nr:peptidoglycan DD-metalloendopeptidase family protein [Methylovulum sp.]